MSAVPAEPPSTDGLVVGLDEVLAELAINGRGTCARGNQTREMPGWYIKLIESRPHTIRVTTPTGHHCLSRAPDPP